MTKLGKYTWILFAALILAVYFFALDVPLLGPDEPRYSQVAREMFDRGDWITTTLGGFNWFEKPALLYWLQITFYNLFGVSEFSARFGSALFGLGTVLSMYLLGRGVKKSSRSETSELPFWLGLVTASSIGIIAFSHGASFDIIITFPVTASLVSFFVWETKYSVSKGNSGLFYLFLFYFFIGVALLAKGLIGIVFPIAIVLFYYLLRWKLPSTIFILSLFWGGIVSAIVAATWYLPMYLTNGWEFIDEFFIQHHFQRFTSNKYKHPQPFWFFFLVLPLMTVPWIPFFLASIWGFIRDLFSRKAAEDQGKSESRIANYELRLFALAWMLVPLVFFSLSGSKLPGYILPALPGACILTAVYVERFVSKSDTRKYLVQAFAFCTFAVIVFLLKFALPVFAIDDSVKGLIDAANSNGYKTEKILNVKNISHNAEFYGAGRLVRDGEGKQRSFDTIEDVGEYLDAENRHSVLVLLPTRLADQTPREKELTVKVLAKTTELAIIVVKRK